MSVEVGQSWWEEDGLLSADEFNLLFHKAQLNLVAFKPLVNCMGEVRRLVEMAILEDREKRTEP